MSKTDPKRTIDNFIVIESIDKASRTGQWRQDVWQPGIAKGNCRSMAYFFGVDWKVEQELDTEI